MVTRNNRVFQWYSKELRAQTLAAGAATNLPLFSVADVTATAIKGATVTRTLMYLRLSGASIAETNLLYWGLVLVNADAAVAGAFPDPQDLSDRPGWIGRGRLENNMSLSINDSSQWTVLNLDLRSQRILHTEETEYHLVLDNDFIFIGIISAFVRTLMRMP